LANFLDVFSDERLNFLARYFSIKFNPLMTNFSSMDELLQALLKFRNERDWAQFHNAKDLALALNVEAGELLELYLWKDAQQANPEKVKEELADVFAYAILLADKYGFDVKEIVLEKIQKNAAKYPVDKAKGTAKKYDEL
jgi:NTP pyrophosphatase (non-canonical NTP hydrolase)